MEPESKEISQKEQEKSSRQAKREQRQDEKKQNRKPIRRIFPIWLRIIVVFLLSFLALIAGLMIGFSVLGNGNAFDVLEFQTWQHILDIVTGES